MSTGMRNGWLIATAVMLVICLVTGWYSIQLALFDRLGPGPGFFPFWLVVIGTAMCLAILLQTLRSVPEPTTAPEPATVFPRGADLGVVAAVLACLALPPLLMDFLGYRLAIGLFAAVLLVALGERRWWAVALFAAGAGFGTFHLFNNWLDVILPTGVLGF